MINEHNKLGNKKTKRWSNYVIYSNIAPYLLVLLSSEKCIKIIIYWFENDISGCLSVQALSVTEQPLTCEKKLHMLHIKNCSCTPAYVHAITLKPKTNTFIENNKKTMSSTKNICELSSFWIKKNKIFPAKVETEKSITELFILKAVPK